MASTKRERAESARESQESDVASSGVRLESERATTPAPAPTSTDDFEAPALSRRPTEVPRYDVIAHAHEVSLRHPPPPRMPNDVAIPVRTSKTPRTDLELRAAFVLLHVDGRASIAEVAALTALPVEEVSVLFVGLVADGLVTLSGD